MVIVPKRRAIRAVAASTLAAWSLSCASPSGRPSSPSPAPRSVASNAWVDSVLARMTLRQKVAQMVWPFMLGDYSPTTTPAWRQLERLVAEEEVGGFIISVGSPLDIATKVNTRSEERRVGNECS